MSAFDDYQAALLAADEEAGDASTDAVSGSVKPLDGGWEFLYLTREGTLLARVVVDANGNAEKVE